MAKKLNMSTTGYAKIESGQTKLQSPRLEKIAEALEMELQDLLSFNVENIFRDWSFQNAQNIYINSAIELTQELEKMRIELAAKKKENELLNEQILQLKETNALLKRWELSIVRCASQKDAHRILRGG